MFSAHEKSPGLSNAGKQLLQQTVSRLLYLSERALFTVLGFLSTRVKELTVQDKKEIELIDRIFDKEQNGNIFKTEERMCTSM